MFADRLILTLLATPRHMLETLRIWSVVHRRRRAMAETAPHLLEDMGITQAELDAEVARPFWDVTEAERAALIDPAKTPGSAMRQRFASVA